MNPDIVLTRTRHGRFFVPSNDYMGQTFIEGEHFEDDLLSRILLLLDGIRDRNVVDVGANFGGHAIPYAKRTRATVYAFEPQTLVYDLLVMNIKLNKTRNVVPYKIALGHQDELVTSLGGVYEVHNQVRSLNEEHSIHNYGGIGLGDGLEQATMKTLDSYNLGDVGLIKIDVEGAERLVLYGAATTVSHQKPYIVFERHPAQREKIFEERWNALCKMYSVPASVRKTGIFDLLKTELGYSEVYRVDESNYLAVP